jgi:hypothetical protein
MPEVTIKHEIDTDEATFWSKVFFEERFNKELFEGSLGFPSWKILDTKEDDSKITRLVHVDPKLGDLPGPMKKALGDRFSYKEEGTFDKKTKRYTFKVAPSAMADKTKMGGEIWVEPISDKKIRRCCRAYAEVKVFMIGGMIEDRILADIKTAYDSGAGFTNKFIKDNGL